MVVGAPGLDLGDIVTVPHTHARGPCKGNIVEAAGTSCCLFIERTIRRVRARSVA